MSGFLSGVGVSGPVLYLALSLSRRIGERSPTVPQIMGDSAPLAGGDWKTSKVSPSFTRSLRFRIYEGQTEHADEQRGVERRAKSFITFKLGYRVKY